MSFKNKTSGRVLLPFGLDYSDVLSQGQAVEGPTLELPVHGALSPQEEATAKQTLALTKLLYDGPFYTGTTHDERSSDSIERYSDRYVKVKKVGRSIDEYPYQLEFFPEELYSVMGITKKKKTLLLSAYKEDGGLAQYDVKPDAQSMLEKLKDLADDLDADPAGAPPDDEDDDDFDDQFEEDDDDDYNAEKYFDDGDDDMPDDGDDEAAF